jgi:hypothetical protein
MLKKYIAKFVMDVFPSVIATIIGAYIVNHYIVTRPAAVAPVTAAVSTADPSTADPKATDAKSTDAKAAKSDVKGSDKGAETPSDVATEPGLAQKNTSDKPTETASLPVETRRHPPSGHDKTVAKSVPASALTPAPAVAAVSSVPLVEANPPHEERRDATDLAREAIERWRGASETSRAPQAPRAQDAPRIAAAPVQPLPPPIVVASPSADGYNSGTTGSTSPVYAPVARAEDPRRPTPPADIPAVSPPMDIHDETMASLPEHKNVITVAQDVLSAAKSVFHAVLPH